MDMTLDQAIDPLFFTVTDLKQFTYCPRVLFYEKCLPHIRPRTFKMDAGRDEHELEERRAIRRTLSKYDVAAGSRAFDVAIEEAGYGLRAKLDEVVTTAEGEIFPVDYKLAEKVGENHKLQLTAYAMLLEVTRSVKIQRGFIYLIPKQRTVEVLIHEQMRKDVVKLLAEMKTMVVQEAMPNPTDVQTRCFSCEFRRFCNDVP